MCCAATVARADGSPSSDSAASTISATDTSSAAAAPTTLPASSSDSGTDTSSASPTDVAVPQTPESQSMQNSIWSFVSQVAGSSGAVAPITGNCQCAVSIALALRGD